ncbi:hypothetical protein VD0002_g1408 [Verticillium dahliae]|uniref:Uncharacterized protein n=1 Tax=Verticillium dahliae TaxID=27337 RepID=A0AA44WJ40_VERDA|nr:hypothetical protein BJF96_g4367 [Verticillium dahliae]PNH54693.1 hypothetical protein VD0003_g2876 [Verticillium dahliae]PNH68730.1 hypothetical protein VD0002_g1408 [Verticillium dahliae]PNH76042.1 hypothetical protein VD0001_g1493 [Verticillium dahliae]
MEPPAKRQRLSHTPASRHQHEDDELDFEFENVDHQRDSGFQLAESRAFAAYKLKSTFEHIFEKYERDFTGIADEIDLRTGEIVVDNGHIQRLGLGGVDSVLEEDGGMLLEDARATLRGQGKVRRSLELQRTDNRRHPAQPKRLPLQHSNAEKAPNSQHRAVLELSTGSQN